VDVKLCLAPVTGEPNAYVRSLQEPGTGIEEYRRPSGHIEGAGT